MGNDLFILRYFSVIFTRVQVLDSQCGRCHNNPRARRHLAAARVYACVCVTRVHARTNAMRTSGGEGSDTRENGRVTQNLGA